MEKEISGMQCPNCENRDRRLLCLHGKKMSSGKKVQRYKCTVCGYHGTAKTFGMREDETGIS